MTAPVLALTKLYDDVVARFAAESATIAAPLYLFAGTSVPTIDDGSVALGTFDIRVRFTVGGTVGVAGIMYELSVDGGATWSDATPLGTAVEIDVPDTGVTIDLSDGTIVDDDGITITTSKSTAVTNAFGWREPAKRTGKRRLVWVPGNDGDVGKLLPARQPGRNPRPLATLHELFTVYVEGQDPTSPEDERAQYVITRLLFDAWYRAAYIAAHGNLTIESAKWVDEKKERRFGATIRLVCTIQSMVPDAPMAVAPEDVTAELDVTELDVTEPTTSSS